ncbi:MAG: hypothetical protein ACAI25_09855, partial [Planctomycetota bacterium]
MRKLLPVLLVAVAAPFARAGDEATQLWLDHAVAASEHVVRGRYDGGRLDPLAELKGALAARPVQLDRSEVELLPAQLAPGTPAMKGEGFLFLQKRFDGAAADPRRLIPWEGVDGVAWLGTVAALGYRAGDDERFALLDLAKKEDFEKLLAASLERDKQLHAAVALVDSKARAAKLVELVRSAHDAPEAVLAELGPDPVAERAIVEIGLVHEADLLDELRRGAKRAWVKSAAVRALAP